jgi:NAD(P)-binding Rossmann-like domain
MSAVTVVGGGIGGLVTAIEAAERSFDVELHESKAYLGGRAVTSSGAFHANLGPHVLYDDGPLWRWLDARHLAEPAMRVPKLSALYFRIDGRRRRVLPVGLLGAVRRIRAATAPIEASFSEWAEPLVGATSARQIANFAGVVTFDHDPGRLAAAFVQQRVRRATAFPPRARYVPGGWITLVDRLARHAARVGVTIRTDSHVTTLPNPPVVLALPMRAARTLLLDDSLLERGTSVACLDIGLRGGRKPPLIVSDLDAPGWVETYSIPDPTLAPEHHHLLQTQAGLRPGESLESAVGRLEVLLDVGIAGWREREAWRRRYRLDNSTGALDLPGQSWPTRAAVDRGKGRYLVNDQVAAPGLLSEVSWAAAMEAIASIGRAPVDAFAATQRRDQ